MLTHKYSNLTVYCQRNNVVGHRHVEMLAGEFEAVVDNDVFGIELVAA